MPVTGMWALQWAWISPVTSEHSVTLAGWPGAQLIFAEVQLAQVIHYPMLTPGYPPQLTPGGAYMWISKRRFMSSDDQVLQALDPDPSQDNVVAWIPRCLSVSFTLRVTGAWAAGIAKASLWA
jgi:hypothetical protein